MPENNLDKLNPAELWAFIVVIISGAIGACSGAFLTRTKEKKLLNVLSFCGYAISGVFAALLMFAMTSKFAHQFASWEEIILWSMLTGFVTATSLVANNLVFKIIVKKLGLEIEVSVKRVPKKK
jgi:drug/metabolite transporter (DMT)-like permease